MTFDANHPELKNLKRELKESPKDFVAIVGAGLSRPCGLPGWEGLKDILISEAKARACDYSEGEERNLYIEKLGQIEKIDKKNIWYAFTKLKTELGALFYDIIEQALNIDKRKVPETYETLWSLDIKGIISFNLDKCAEYSHAKVFLKSADTATFKENAIYPQFIASKNKFVFYPHGKIVDKKSWVFTQSDITELLSDEYYIDFIKTIIRTKQLIIVGYDPTDFSFDYLIREALFQFAGNTQRHYIVINNPSEPTKKQLESYGIRIIPYSDETGEHKDVEEILTSIFDFIPSDKPAHTVYDKQVDNLAIDLADTTSLFTRDINDVRSYLNSYVAKIIPPTGTPTEEQITALDDFYKNNVRIINDAWLVKPFTARDTLYNYKVISPLGMGAFGIVYEAETIDDRTPVAIKILHDHNLNKEYLNSFRRGVNSMRILTEKDVKGMVHIIDAYEVPACIIMEIINGATLREAIEDKLIHDATSTLEVLVHIGDVVNNAHNLEERVLHRDLKPENIILKNKFSDQDENDVVVLDFDLSWHKGASEMSISPGARTQGYAAPEQSAERLKDGTTTRHTSVDTFGYGMLAFFLFLLRDPRQNEQNFPNFRKNIETEILQKHSSKWRSLPFYLSHIIESCTYDNQADRISFSSAVDNFRLCYEMSKNDKLSKPLYNLLLVEIAYRISPIEMINIDEMTNKLTVEHTDKSKTTILSITTLNKKPAIHINIIKTRADFDRRNIGKYLPRAISRTTSSLKSGPFVNITVEEGESSVNASFYFVMTDEVSARQIEEVSNNITIALRNLELQ